MDEIELTEEDKEDGLVVVKCTNCDVSLMSHRDLMNLSICLQCKSRNTLYVEDDNVKKRELGNEKTGCMSIFIIGFLIAVLS